MSWAFSDRLHNTLTAMEKGQWRGGRACFPRQIDGQDLRVADAETPNDWFHRCVRDYLGHDVEACAIEDNLGVFLKVSGTGENLRAIHCQAFAVLGKQTLQDAYDGRAADIRYLRLDFDQEEIGDLFSHPYPHIHSQPADAPRFPLIPSAPECCLIDFLESLLLNFSYRTWLAWARRVLRHQATVFDELLERLRDPGVPRKADELRGRREALVPLLRMLQAEKRGMPFAFPLDLDGLEAVNYSCLRSA